MAYIEKSFAKHNQTLKLREAVERAAKIERGASFQYQHNARNTLIYSCGAAWQRGLGIGPSLPKKPVKDALLLQNARRETVIKLETVRRQLLRAFYICESLSYFLNQETA
jgi:hypothetical protein